MTPADKVIDRIRKLFRLSQSDNPAEAATALAHAQRLMASHRIEQAQLDAVDDEEIKIWNDEPLESAPAIAPWRQAIGGALAELNDCLCLVTDKPMNGHRKMAVAGRRSDFEVCVAMYTWIVATIDRLAANASSRLGRRMKRSGMGRRWLNSFRHGAAAEVEARLYQEDTDRRGQLAADPNTSEALAVRHDAVHDWAKDNLETRDSRGRSPDVDPEAFRLGALMGRVMPLKERDESG